MTSFVCRMIKSFGNEILVVEKGIGIDRGYCGAEWPIEVFLGARYLDYEPNNSTV